MLELLDLRERGERLEPRLEIDPTVADTVAGSFGASSSKATRCWSSSPAASTAPTRRGRLVVAADEFAGAEATPPASCGARSTH